MAKKSSKSTIFDHFLNFVTDVTCIRCIDDECSVITSGMFDGGELNVDDLEMVASIDDILHLYDPHYGMSQQ